VVVTKEPAGGQGAIPVRRLIALLTLAGCAQAGMPPGGPPDTQPPRLVRVTPDTNALNVRDGSISFQFDEVVSERPRGVPGLAELFIVSPSKGPSAISWRRTRVAITPRGGLRPNTTYSVRMLPGLVDLDNNADSTGMTLVFSTGPSLATGRIVGRAFDWVAARPAPNSVVEAITLPDSARYATHADSSGAFALTHLPPGQFLLKVYIDADRDALHDERELFDTSTVTLADSLQREMLATVRDTVGPGLVTAELRDSLTLRLTLDRPLDTLFTPTAAMFSLKAADSSDVPFASVLTQAELDRQIADSTRRKAVEDSVRRAFITDSTRQLDSTRAAVSERAPMAAQPAPPTRPTGRRPGATTAPPPAAPRDTTSRIIPRPAARIPVMAVYMKFARPLPAGGAFRIEARDLRSVTGVSRTSQRVFTTPRRVVRPDTGRVRPDTGRLTRG